ncbi:MAG: TrkH family potassium uptake protein [Peptococcaceae bacterium]
MAEILKCADGSGNNKDSQKSLNPWQVLVFGFIGVIILGTILLMTPYATNDQNGLSFINALFTATSAVCVTGLVVVDTGTFLAVPGQIVVMILIQIGGLGIMTLATMMGIILGKKISLKERLLLQEALNQISIQGLVKLVRYIVFMTIFFEAAGAVILSLRFSLTMSWEKAVYYGIFHSISAFNNAGFDLMGNYTSLTGYTADWIISLTIAVLFIIGGLGFVVIVELYQKKCSFSKLSLHSKVVLSTTAGLALLGFLIILVFEYTNTFTLGSLRFDTKLLASFFQGVTPRTAGFNTVDIAVMRMPTQFFIIFLMFIGASPGSTAGGIKTTTFAAAVIAIINTIKGKENASLFERNLNKEIITKSFAIIGVAMFLVITTTMILTITETADFLALLFEATSAFGTVGLSMGITPRLSLTGRIIIIFTMFAGRVGPLTLAFALARKKTEAKFQYPQEKIMIG